MSFNANGIEAPGDIKLMLILTLPGGIKGPILPDPACPVPPPGQTDSYSNSLYVVHLQPGISILDNNGKPTCGYHETMSVQEVAGSQIYNCNFAFAVVAEAQADGQTCQYTESAENNLDTGTINDYTALLSHELIEAIVDPWINRLLSDGKTLLEVGDLCQSSTVFMTTTMPSNSGPPWLVTPPWSVLLNSCLTTGFGSWDADYQSSGFAVARGPFHLDTFSVLQRDGGVHATRWDAAFNSSFLGAWGPPGEETLAANAVAPVGAPVTAVATGPVSAAAVVAGSDGQIHMSTCDSETGCFTIGEFGPMTTVTATNGSYSVLPGTPISALGGNYPYQPSLFFEGSQGEILELSDTFGEYSLSVISGAGTLSAPKSYVTAIVEYNASPFPSPPYSAANYVTRIFAATFGGTILTFTVDSSGIHGAWIPNSNVTPGAQIAAASRYPGQLDVFAADNAGAVQSYWQSSYGSGVWGTVNPPIMGPGTTVAGAGVALAARSDHMDVFTSCVANCNLMKASFDQNVGWGAAQGIVTNTSFPVGVPLQAVSPYRDRVDVFGLLALGDVAWAETEFAPVDAELVQ